MPDSRLSQPQLAAILARYDIAAPGVVPEPDGTTNSSYLIRGRSASYVLTVLDDHDENSARRLTALLDHLVRHGVPTSRPLRGRDGTELTTFGGTPVLVKQYLRGDCRAQLPRYNCAAAGELLGRVHTVPVPNWLPRRGRRLPAGWLAQVDTFADRRFADWLREQWVDAAAVETLAGPYGLVHGEYAARNLVVGEDGRLAVLDWETASHDLLVLDLGAALIRLCAIDGRFDADRAAALLAGYRRSRELTDAEYAHLRAAAHHAGLRIAYHRYLRYRRNRPNPVRAHLYRALPGFLASLDQHWPRLLVNSGARGR
ncbi:homoserine kinase [Micromonospora pisi]|uniref:Homoserine kinase n=1 Tax=Micromonospora pisi TaxID=589240 RepID=A0A495JNE6_9ACTN|nr:phosphotransferase [Micromonospora pisi]RKR90466.1 homoserine kinase [Micromonospora pisi]